MEHLPKRVVARDKLLRKSAERLCQLRWHWTLNEANPDKMRFAAYAREVGVNSDGQIRTDAKAWIKWSAAAAAHASGKAAVKPKKIDVYRQQESMSEERNKVIEALARSTGKSYSTIAKNKNYSDEVQLVLTEARLLMEQKLLELDEAIAKIIDAREEMRDREEKKKKQRSEHVRQECWKMQGYLNYAVGRVRHAYLIAEYLVFGEEERDILSHSLSSLRALVNLLDRKVSGEERTDWDQELRKLMKDYEAESTPRGGTRNGEGVEVSEGN